MKDYPAFAVAYVQDGRLRLSVAQNKVISAYLRRHEGDQVRITLSQPTKARSHPQNRYYWGVVLTMIAVETGHTTEEIHEYMKAMYLPRHFIRIGKSGKEQQLVKSTITLSTLEFEEYQDHIRAFAAQELNLHIPLPHEIEF